MIGVSMSELLLATTPSSLSVSMDGSLVQADLSVLTALGSLVASTAPSVTLFLNRFISGKHLTQFF